MLIYIALDCRDSSLLCIDMSWLWNGAISGVASSSVMIVSVYLKENLIIIPYFYSYMVIRYVCITKNFFFNSFHCIFGLMLI